MRYMVSSGIRGNSQCNNGAMMREECSKEFASLDAEKISAIQINAGSQYLRNARNLSTANQNRIQRAGQSEMLRMGARTTCPCWRAVPHWRDRPLGTS